MFILISLQGNGGRIKLKKKQVLFSGVVKELFKDEEKTDGEGNI